MESLTESMDTINLPSRVPFSNTNNKIAKIESDLLDDNSASDYDFDNEIEKQRISSINKLKKPFIPEIKLPFLVRYHLYDKNGYFNFRQINKVKTDNRIPLLAFFL